MQHMAPRNTCLKAERLHLVSEVSEEPQGFFMNRLSDSWVAHPSLRCAVCCSAAAARRNRGAACLCTPDPDRGVSRATQGYHSGVTTWGNP